MASLVRVAVFDACFFQCRSPSGFADRLVVFPGLVGAGIVEDAIILLAGECLLVEQGCSGLGL